MNLYGDLENLLDRAKNGGFSESVVGENTPYGCGFMVGGVVPSLSKDADALTVADMVRFVGENWDALANWRRYFGGWKADGMIFFDVSEWIMDFSEAMKLARERGELAIWDVKGGVEIPVTY